MFDVTINTVREMTTNGPTYMQGRHYYRQGLIKHLSYQKDKGIILAHVQGTRTYAVRIILDRSGALHDASCTCSAFTAYWGLCKHIAAVLLYCIDTYGGGKTHIEPASRPLEFLPAEGGGQKTAAADRKARQQVLRRSRTKTRAFMAQLERVVRLSSREHKETVRLRVVLTSPRQTGSLPSLTFALGLDSVYAVKNVEQFAEAISRDLSLKLNRHFTFDPLTHAFDSRDLPLIHMIRDAFEHDYKSVFGTSHTATHSQTFPLNPSRFAAFLRLCAGLTDASWKTARTAKAMPIKVLEKPLPIELTLAASKGINRQVLPLQLHWTVREKIQPLTASRNVFLVGQTFYLPDPDAVRLLEPVLSHFSVPGSQTLDLTRQEASRLLSLQNAAIRAVCPLTIHPDLADQVIDEPLQAALSLDSVNMELKATLSYSYGSYCVNPLEDNETEPRQVVVRDCAAESRLEAALEAAGFGRQGQHLRLKDTDALYHFLDQGLTDLQQTARIQWSESARQLVIHPVPALLFSFSLSEEPDGLLLTQDTAGMDQQAFDRYCQAVGDDRPFVRNSDGSFRKVNPLHRTFLPQLVSLLDFWQVTDQGTHLLPRYRMLSLAPFIQDPALDGSVGLSIDPHLADMVNQLLKPTAVSCAIPAHLNKHLRPYQKTGVRWLYMLDRYGLGGILADDMGLGKTLQTITFIRLLWRRSKKTSLVIAPTSLIYNWAHEFEKFDPKLPVLLLDGNRQQRSDRVLEISRNACVITSYALIRRDIAWLKEVSFGSCFLDEAQNIKNPETLNARSVKQINTDRAFALTGTPIENSLLELWSLFDFILPGFLHDQKRFQARYETPIVKEQDQDALTALHQQVMPFILRRMKRDVLKELPDKIESNTICDMTEDQRAIYDAFLDQSRQDLKEEIEKHGYARSQIYILALLTRLRQICCHPSLFLKQYTGGSGKLLLLEELLSDSFSSGHRVLVFSQFTSMLDIIRKRQLQQGNVPFYIDGQVSSEERIQQVNTFNSGSGNLFLISLRAGGTGLNLTGADTVIHYDPWWNPAVEEQATDRAYRIGQENVVQVFKLCTRNSVEEKILALQAEKQNLIDAVIKPGQNLLSKMSVDEVLALFDP